jgi:hypothetical protein
LSPSRLRNNKIRIKNADAIQDVNTIQTDALGKNGEVLPTTGKAARRRRWKARKMARKAQKHQVKAQKPAPRNKQVIIIISDDE